MLWSVGTPVCFPWLSFDNRISEKKSKGWGLLQIVRGLACHSSQQTHQCSALGQDHPLLWGHWTLHSCLHSPDASSNTHLAPPPASGDVV